MSGPLFGVVPAGNVLITEPVSTPTPTSFLYALPTSKPFSHIVVFLLPGIQIPDDSAAAIYLATESAVSAEGGAASSSNPNFRFLGAIGSGKESAMFQVTAGRQGQQQLLIGVSVEPAESVAPRLQNLAANPSKATGGGAGTMGSQPSTAVLAQRIIQNAFNFLTGFSGTAGPGGVEVVPLKAFEDWWRKFESRVRADPSFLEKQPE